MVTKMQVENAQRAWGEGIVSIAAAHNTGMDYVERARTHIKSLYAYGTVSYTHLTLPTKA